MEDIKMKKLLLTLMVAFLGLTITQSHAQGDLTGRQIMDQVKDANKTQGRIAWARLTVLDKGKEVETRQIITKTFRENNLDRIVFRFLSGLKRNVTFLTIEQTGNKDNLQYIYIPNVGRPRQIASAEKQNDFEDTDFTNENLGGMKLDDYNFSRLADRSVKIGQENFDCYIIMAETKDSSARFPKTRMFVDKKTLIPVQMHIFGKDGRPARMGVSAQIKEITKGVFMPFYVYAKDLPTGHETKMSVVDVKVNPAGIKAQDFRPANMSKPWMEQGK